MERDGLLKSNDSLPSQSLVFFFPADSGDSRRHWLLLPRPRHHASTSRARNRRLAWRVCPGARSGNSRPHPPAFAGRRCPRDTGTASASRGAEVGNDAAWQPARCLLPMDIRIAVRGAAAPVERRVAGSGQPATSSALRWPVTVCEAAAGLGAARTREGRRPGRRARGLHAAPLLEGTRLQICGKPPCVAGQVQAGQEDWQREFWRHLHRCVHGRCMLLAACRCTDGAGKLWLLAECLTLKMI